MPGPGPTPQTHRNLQAAYDEALIGQRQAACRFLLDAFQETIETADKFAVFREWGSPGCVAVELIRDAILMCATPAHINPVNISPANTSLAEKVVCIQQCEWFTQNNYKPGSQLPVPTTR